MPFVSLWLRFFKSKANLVKQHNMFFGFDGGDARFVAEVSHLFIVL